MNNDYIFLFANTDSQTHEYYFEIVNNENIHIVRPKKAFKIKSGKKRKEVVILETQKMLNNDSEIDIPISLHIRAYSVNDDANISVDRKTVFVYPNADAFIGK